MFHKKWIDVSVIAVCITILAAVSYMFLLIAKSH